MRNTAERNISAMSVKWSSKELANPRAISVIYDGEPITSRLRKWLGKSKYELYTKDEYSLDKFADPLNKRGYTLAELKALDKEAFEAVGL